MMSAGTLTALFFCHLQFTNDIEIFDFQGILLLNVGAANFHRRGHFVIVVIQLFRQKMEFTNLRNLRKLTIRRIDL